jgi:hypothetical protein
MIATVCGPALTVAGDGCPACAVSAAIMFRRNKNPYANIAVRTRSARKLAMCNIKLGLETADTIPSGARIRPNQRREVAIDKSRVSMSGSFSGMA